MNITEYIEATRNLIEVTREMRDAQQHYFSTRDPYALRRCKALEKQVDRMLRTMPSI